MNTQLIIYEELKKGKMLSRHNIKVLLNTTIQNAGQHFKKVSKLQGVQIITVEEIRDCGAGCMHKQRYLVEYLKFNI